LYDDVGGGVFQPAPPLVHMGCQVGTAAFPMGWSSEYNFSLPDQNIKTGMIKIEVLPSLPGETVDLDSVPPPDIKIVETFQYRVNGKVASQAAIMQTQPAKAFSFSFRKANGRVF